MDKNIVEQFAPFDIALFMKLKDFNDQCLGYYAAHHKYELALFDRDAAINCNEYCGGFTRMFRSSEGLKNCTAPTWTQAIDWFEFKYKMFLTPMYQSGRIAYKCQILNNDIRLMDSDVCETYYNLDKYESLREAFARMILHVLDEPTPEEIEEGYAYLGFTGPV